MVLVSTTDYEIPTTPLVIDRQKDPGQPKAYIPEYLYKPPYGFPRKADLRTIRKLAATPYVHLIVRTLAQQVGTTKWNIKVKEEFQDDDNDYKEEIGEITKFLKNPNDNDDSWEDLLVAWATDILEIDSGIGVKVFNKKGDMTQVVARDGATFLKNPTIYGMMTDRADIIPALGFSTEYAKPSVTNPFVAGEEVNVDREQFLRGFYDANLKEKAAYFQYGWTAGRMPIPFGRREIMWFSSNKRTDTIYGRSPVQVLGDVLFTLLYGSSFSLDMFINNNIPAGIVQIIGANNVEIEAFKHRFEDKFIQKDVFSNMKKQWWNAPTVNQEVKWTPFNFNSKDMEVLASQLWYLKIVAGCFGLTPSELGFTENSNKAVDANQGVVFKRKALAPLLRLIQHRVNTQLMPEFRVEALEFSFDDYDFDEDKKKHDILDQEIRMGVKTSEMAAVELGINVEELVKGKEEEREKRLEEESLNSGADDDNFFREKSKELKFRYVRRFRSGGKWHYVYPEDLGRGGDKKTPTQALKEAYAGLSEKDARKIEKSVLEYENKTDTHNKHLVNGEYTPARAKLHDKIKKKYDGLASKATPVGKPRVIYMAGLPASGKTYATMKEFSNVPGTNKLVKEDNKGNRYLVLNADDLKGELPEFEGTNAPSVHRESSTLNADLIERYQGSGVNLIIDGTMAKTGKAKEQLEVFDSLGYRKDLIHVDVPVQTSIRRAANRFSEERRFVGYGLIVDMQKGVSNSVGELKDKFDSVKVIDNDSDF